MKKRIRPTICTTGIVHPKIISLSTYHPVDGQMGELSQNTFGNPEVNEFCKMVNK